MSNSRKKFIDSNLYGVSFSLKQCQNFQLSPVETLDWLIIKARFRRFRLMSYWNEHEKQQGEYDFGALDKQIDAISKANGVISLCLGARQPRWPENHWPDWAWKLDKKERSQALLRYIEVVVKRYKNKKCIISWQLENEALLKGFGTRPEIDRHRLRQEYTLLKNLNPSKPVIMSTSNSWGIPLRRPIPDIVGFSYYQTIYSSGAYTTTLHRPWLHKFRAFIIKLLWQKPSFIHELQLEPWGPKNIWEMSSAEQAKSMSPAHIRHNLELAQKTNLYPIDLWGCEWWYWKIKQGEPEIWQVVEENLLSS